MGFSLRAARGGAAQGSSCFFGESSPKAKKTMPDVVSAAARAKTRMIFGYDLLSTAPDVEGDSDAVNGVFTPWTKTVLPKRGSLDWCPDCDFKGADFMSQAFTFDRGSALLILLITYLPLSSGDRQASNNQQAQCSPTRTRESWEPALTKTKSLARWIRELAGTDILNSDGSPRLVSTMFSC